MDFIISILITATAYLIVPLIFSIIGFIADRGYSPKTIWAIVIINGVCVWLIFQIIRINAGETGPGAAVFLWSTVAYWMLRTIPPEEQEKEPKKKKKYTRQFTAPEPEKEAKEESIKPNKEKTKEQIEKKKRHDELSAVVMKMIGDQELLEMVKTLSNLDSENRQAVKSVLTALSKDNK